MKIIFNICLLLFIGIIACTKEIELKTEKAPSKLVLNCILAAGQRVTVHLSQTIPIYTDSIAFIENAKIELLENDSLVDILVSSGQGLYTSMINAKEGALYVIKASSPGFEEVIGTDSIPQEVYIEKASADYGLFLYSYQDEMRYGLDYKTTIQDPVLIENYYEIIFFEKKMQNGFYQYSIFNTYVYPDPLFSSEDYFGYLPNQFIFSDSYFNGRKKDIIMKMADSYYGLDKPNSLNALPDGYSTIIRSVSKNYYLFFKSWIKHQHNLQISTSTAEAIYEGLTGDPIPLYTNVKNGYGIVAAYSQAFYKTELIDHTK